ncbi:MAG: hypothetical protein DA329_12285, partial [Candidatus Nitrosocosmicus sp.]|nr:hypothetical protein [Candidatus Nitrosocosmicus sp.]
MAALIVSLPLVGQNDVSATNKKSNETSQLLKQFSRSESAKESCTENNTFASSIKLTLTLLHKTTLTPADSIDLF